MRDTKGEKSGMDVLNWLERMFEQYGYWVLLLGLPVDFIALPLPPAQTTLTFTGYLSYKGVLDWVLSMLFGYAGSVIGVTITYLIGYKVGAPLIHRYGKWIMLNEANLEKTKRTYEKYGNRMLLISFFVPGVRQFFGYFVGMMKVPFREFALYGYTGAALWVFVFVNIGYLFGDGWQLVLSLVVQYLKYFFIGVGLLLLIVLAMKWRKQRIKNLQN